MLYKRTTLILILCLLHVGYAQFGEFYKFLLDDEFSEDKRQDERQPKSVTRVSSGSDESNASLDRNERIVDHLGDIVSKTENLFARVLGVLGDPRNSDDERDTHRARNLQPKKEEKGSSEKSTAMDVFDIIGTLGGLPMTMSTLKGPHICVREKRNELNATKSRKMVKSCLHFRDAQKCVDRSESSRGGKETIRIEECCEGYDSDDIFRYGCNKEIEPVSVEDLLNQRNNSAADLFEKAKLKFLTEKGPLTYLIPREQYVDELKDSASLSSLLSHVVLAGSQRDYDWNDGQTLTTVGEGELFVTQENEGSEMKTTLNCVPLVRTNIRVRNGIVHFTDGVLYPADNTILELLEKKGTFKIFISLLDEDLRLSLSSPSSHFTVFPFTDSTFEGLSPNVKEQITGKKGCVKDLVRSHIVRSAVCSSALSQRTLFSVGGRMLRTQESVTSDGSIIRIGSSRLVESNLVAGNGVVHVVDDLLVPEDLLNWRDHLAKYNEPLLNALQNSLFDEPVTIFVPPVSMTENNTDDSFYLNHVVSNTLFKANSEPMTLKTEANSTIFAGTFKQSTSPISIRISMGAGKVKKGQIGCSRIIGEEVKSCNSIMYFIDKPLPLVNQNLEEFFAARKELSKFFEILKKSSSAKLLSSEAETVTIFAPSNDAFSNNELRKLFSNQTKLDAFAKRYVVMDVLCLSDLSRERREIKFETLHNLLGETLLPRGEEGEVYVEGARIEDADLLSTNGVVHILESTIQRPFSSPRAPSSSSRLPISLFDIFGS